MSHFFPDGAGGSSPPEQYAEALRGKIVYIIQDNDTPGKTFARKATGAYIREAKQIKVIDGAGLGQAPQSTETRRTHTI